MSSRAKKTADALRQRLDDYLDSRIAPEVRARLELVRDRLNDYGYDPFGFNPDALRYILPFATWLYTSYFRVQTFDIDRVPAHGRVLLIANHSGQIPIDGMMIGTSLLLDRDPPRIMRSMVERWVSTLPFVSYLFPRWGQIVGSPDNCRALFEREAAILAFPEGVRGVNKTYDQRYQLQEFGLGFMRLALEGKVPIVPVAVIGAEEQIISLYNAKGLARLMGMPAFPVGPGLLLGPLGMVTPMPTRYRLHFGEPMYFTGDPNDDDSVVGEKVAEVKRVLELLINDGLKSRSGVFK